MPIYMDLHIVPGVKAKGVAEAHQLDVKLEEEFNCKCMTYWVDEARGNVFCLIDAPSREAVIQMHGKAHGLIPHRIIEVQPSLVESFLGRVSDPDEKAETKEGLKIFHDSSFRILLLATIQDLALLQHRFGREKTAAILQHHQQVIRSLLESCEGKEVESKGPGFMASFTSATKAVKCALAITEKLSEENTGLRISICAGEPVATHDNLFGDTIKLANRLCFIAPPAKPVLTSVVKELAARDLFQYKAETLSALSKKDEAFLELLFTSLEANWQEPQFMLEDYCQTMAMSQSQLYRKTINLTGLSPNALLKEFRLEKAKEMLRKKTHSVAEISFDNGFTSPSYFTKCFKQKYGLLPLAYVELLS